MRIGNQDNLNFELRLSEQRRHLGFGTLRVSVGQSQIWGDRTGNGVEWTWIDLLDQLARAWPFIKYEEDVPLGTYDSTLALLRRGHFARPDFDFEPVTEIHRDTYIFLRRHNLATGIEGMSLPSFSLLREGKKMWVASSNVAKLLRFDESIATLERLGEELARSISSSTNIDDRARTAIEDWDNREPSPEGAVSIKLGPSQLSLVPANQTVAGYFEVANDGEFESPLLIAARMSAAVPIESRRAILELIRSIPAGQFSERLEEISAEAISAIPNYTMRAHKQGEFLAQWARTRLGIPNRGRADPEKILNELKVDVRLEHFGIEMIDAIGCWSKGHGPAILVNLDGKHAHADAGRRATLAHELAHLLVDRNGSLPAAEVFGAGAPKIPEQRASAFAAEFLLPKAIAADYVRSKGEVEDAVRTLRRDFEVSRELAAWQVINGPAFHLLSPDEQALLHRWTDSSRFFD